MWGVSVAQSVRRFAYYVQGRKLFVRGKACSGAKVSGIPLVDTGGPQLMMLEGSNGNVGPLRVYIECVCI